VNLLAPSGADALERLAGMAHLNGIPVWVEAAAPKPAPNGHAAAEAATASV
jgi:hypothetical protein